MKSSIPLLITGDIFYNVQFDQNENYGYRYFDSDKEEIEYPCVAPAGKHLMCKALNIKYKISVPYHMNIIYHYYDGTKETELYSSIITDLFGSSIHFSTCCISGRQNIDNRCTEKETKNSDFISGSCPVFYNDENNYK